MQAHHPGRRRLGLMLFAIAAGLYLYATLHPKARPVASQTTINHIIDATEPLCRTLLPDRNLLHFAARPYTTFRKNGSARDLWAVECLNNEGREIVHVLWDEDNKRCVSISQVPGDTAHNAAFRLNQEAALTAARSWVTRLNIADPIQTANAPSELRSLERSWRVYLRLPDGIATVWIDANTGALFNVLVRSYPDTSTMQAASPPKQGDVPHS